MPSRYFYHSFPRPKDRPDAAQIEIGLKILEAIRRIGLVLAPETVSWDVPLSSGAIDKVSIFQKRMCFTELAVEELPGHARAFGMFHSALTFLN